MSSEVDSGSKSNEVVVVGGTWHQCLTVSPLSLSVTIFSPILSMWGCLCGKKTLTDRLQSKELAAVSNREVWSMRLMAKYNLPAMECVFLYWLFSVIFWTICLVSKMSENNKTIPQHRLVVNTDIFRQRVLSKQQPSVITHKLTANASIWRAGTNGSLFIFS